MATENNGIRKVSFNIPEDLYCDFKKACIDKRTNPTNAVKVFMREYVKENEAQENESK